MLVIITGVLAGSIFLINVALGRSILESALFALAIAVGLTPQLLPAIVTVSLATGARRLAQRQVIVKRLVCIEDLGNVEVLFTDKTGTLTEGPHLLPAAARVHGRGRTTTCSRWVSRAATRRGTSSIVRSARQRRPREAREPRGGCSTAYRSTTIASSHPSWPSRRRGRLLVAKGAPEAMIARCADGAAAATAELEGLFAAGTRVVAVASRAVTLEQLSHDGRAAACARGFLCFSDPAKAEVGQSLKRLARLGVDRQDHHRRQRPGRRASLPAAGAGAGPGHHRLRAGGDGRRRAARSAAGDDDLRPRHPGAEVAHHPRSAQRSARTSASSATASTTPSRCTPPTSASPSNRQPTSPRTPPTSCCSTKNLGILADGVVEGRRIFANTIKYVLMGTSSNFGNMFSAAGASLFLSFLPMLPTQILLNNLLYDVSEMTIPTDNVDVELVARPSQWDIGLIRRFMTFFGPISSLYDFITFAVMLQVFHAGPSLFQSGWFVESLITQTLVIFVIRTRRVPFFKSHPSRPLLVTTLACAAAGVAIPYIPAVARLFGFRALPLSFLAVLAVMVATYLALAQLGAAFFFMPRGGRSLARRLSRRERRIARRAARWILW